MPLHFSGSGPLVSLRRRVPARGLALVVAGLSTFALADPALAQGLTNGVTHVGEIATPHEADAWTFTANVGEYIAVHVAETGSDSAFSPRVSLFDPNHVQITVSRGNLAAAIAAVAPLTGTYAVVISDDNADGDDTDTGSYRLTLGKAGVLSVSPGDEGGPMTNGANHSGSIYPGDMDVWSLSLSAGSILEVTLAKIGGTNVPFSPWIRILDPDGRIIRSVTNTLAAQVYLTLAAPGTYTVLVASLDSGSDDAGSYILRLANPADPFIVPAGDQGGAMTPGVDYSATIDRADLDQWTFSATAGNHIALEISETVFDRPFQPWIQLYGPNGDLLDGRTGTISAASYLVAPLSGTYRVIVADLDANAGGGTYRMRVGGIVAAASNPLADIVVDFGPSFGVWLRTNQNGSTPQWTQLHGLSPTALASGDIDGNGQSDVIMTFPGYGVWIWFNNATWRPLHPFDASEIVTGDLDGNGKDEIILSFAAYGLWIFYNNANWSPLHGLPSAGMATGNIDGDAGGKSDVLINFAGYGLYAYVNNSTWTLIHPLTAKDMAIGDIDGNGIADLALGFLGKGVWIRYDSGAWSLLDPGDSAGLTFANVDGDPFQRWLILNSPDGVWAWKDAGQGIWLRLHTQRASLLVSSDLDRDGWLDLIISFPGYGIWLWSQTAGYVPLHPFKPDAIVTGLIDDK